MRIIGGEARGRKLKSPRGRSVRPTSERAREALFDILGAQVPGSRFLDLFAGVGAVGLEAHSRGAQQVVLVESSERAARLIRENAQALRAGERVKVVRADAVAALRGLAAAGSKFDIAFMDPPYRDRRALQRALDELTREGGVLAADGVVVVEHDARAALPPAAGAFVADRSRRFGEATLTFFRPQPAARKPQGRPRRSTMATAVYPGSFDPVTNGHLDIIERAAELFDTVVVAVAGAPAAAVSCSKAPLFSGEERVSLLREVCSHLANVRVDSFSGLLVEFVAQQRASVVIKGLRAVSDFEYELQQALMNRILSQGVETIFFMTSPENLFLSSSMVKEIALLGGDVSRFVPAQVRLALEQKVR